VAGNAIGFTDDAQIKIGSSSSTTVSGNTVIVSGAESGILVIQQDRGSGAYGKNYSHDVYVHDNTIILLPGAAGDDKGRNGVLSYFGFWPSGANLVFDYNTYDVPDPTAKHWIWKNDMTWSSFLANGQETHGHLLAATTSVPEPQQWLLLAIAGMVRLLPGVRT
jgi:hypothetical protein